jgi:nucleoside-diphosphate-sugar epimerase
MINIIGGSGFIGSVLCKRFSLSKANQFCILDKNQSSYFPEKVKLVDVRKFDELENLIEDHSQIINLAAEHRDDVSPTSLYQEVNVTGAINICNAARKKNVKIIVFTSSVAVYGFAPVGTSEFGEIAPFNEYGRTKHEAELVYKAWQAESPFDRILVIIRPTVVFGERNRGNVFNLFKQIASGKFVMVGDGENRKSMAYVENVAAFLEFALTFKPGVHIFNYVDKPDFSMNTLVSHLNKLLGRSTKMRIRLPYIFGLIIGKLFDVVAKIANKKFPISAIRVKKFCANSVYDSSVAKTGFVPPVFLMDAIERTVRYEFLENHSSAPLFFSE